MDLSAVCDCGISILLNFESFQAWAEMFPARWLHTYWFVALCQIFVKSMCMTSQIYLTQTTHSNFLNNLFLKIPVQWLVIFLEFFDQISETFGMSTVD